MKKALERLYNGLAAKVSSVSVAERTLYTWQISSFPPALQKPRTHLLEDMDVVRDGKAITCILV